MNSPKAWMEKANALDHRNSVAYRVNPKPESKRRIKRRLKALQRKKAAIDKALSELSRK
jgi:hypothetical protein